MFALEFCKNVLICTSIYIFINIYRCIDVAIGCLLQ